MRWQNRKIWCWGGAMSHFNPIWLAVIWVLSGLVTAPHHIAPHTSTDRKRGNTHIDTSTPSAECSSVSPLFPHREKEMERKSNNSDSNTATAVVMVIATIMKNTTDLKRAVIKFLTTRRLLFVQERTDANAHIFKTERSVSSCALSRPPAHIRSKGKQDFHFEHKI